MKTIKIIAALILVITLSSCNITNHKNGNGNVTIEERTLNQNFDQIKGSSGIDIYLTKGTENKIIVEADENLQAIIETNINNGKLTIRASENIGRSKSKKVFVTYVNLTSIEASSGADIIANSVIKSQKLTLDCSSGADIELEVFTKELFAETSSGADIIVSGKASVLNAKASSGSELDAKKLQVITCSAKASSGADIIVHVKDKLNAKASSGGDVRYYGNPVSVIQKGGPSGSISKM